MKRVPLYLIALVLLASACADTSPPTVRVSVASSLQTQFQNLAERYRAEHGVAIEVNADASSRLAKQIERGAPFDLFVSADEGWAEHVSKSTAFPKTHFGSNRVVLAVRADKPMPSRDEICGTLSVGAALREVPVGRHADNMMKAAQCSPSRLRRASNAAVVRTWLAHGAVDAGFVYETDLTDPRIVEADLEWPSERSDYWVVANDASATVHFLKYAQTNIVLERQTPVHSVSAFRVVRNSIAVGLLAVLFGLVPAIAIGRFLSRREFVGKSILSTIVMAPLVLPPVVTGLWLLELFSPNGTIGQVLKSIGIEVAFGWIGALFAALAVSFPLFVMAVRSSFDVISTKYEDISAACGLTPRQTFFRVTLPLAYPGIIGGAMLAFARSMGEFGATAVVAGNLAAHDGTIALAIYRALQDPEREPLVWGLSAVAVAISLAAFLGYESFVKWQKRRLDL